MATPEVVHLRDTRANQPAAAVGNAGVLYGVTDEGDIIERSNGTTWESYSPASVDQSNVAITGGTIAGITDLAIADGGTGASSSTVAFDNLAPTTTGGDLIYHNGTDNVRLPIGVATRVLTVNAGATAPEWAPPAAGANAFGKIVVSGQSDVDADTSSDTLTLVAGSNVTLTTNAGSDSVTIAAAGGNSFGTVAVSGQSDVVADAANDTLTLAAGSNITITTNAGTDTVTIAASGGNAFGKIVVSGQSDVDADSAADTLTLVAGTGVTLTTNAGSDSVTIAASGGGDLKLISEVVTSGSQATVAFSSIAATYRDLEVRVRARGTNSSTFVNVLLRLNSDSGSNYDWGETHGFGGSTVVAAQGIADTSLFLAIIPAATAPANAPGIVETIISDYRGTTFYKALSSRCSVQIGTGTVTQGNYISGGIWRSTSAVNAATVLLSAGNFVNGSVVSLYGRM